LFDFLRQKQIQKEKLKMQDLQIKAAHRFCSPTRETAQIGCLFSLKGPRGQNFQVKKSRFGVSPPSRASFGQKKHHKKGGKSKNSIHFHPSNP